MKGFNYGVLGPDLTTLISCVKYVIFHLNLNKFESDQITLLATFHIFQLHVIDMSQMHINLITRPRERSKPILIMRYSLSWAILSAS
jgi:hypothetical protein